MTLGQFFDICVSLGRQCDYRGLEGTQAVLNRNKAHYECLSSSERSSFDASRLMVPFGDAWLASGSLESELCRILIDIDVFSEDVLKIRRRILRGERIDLIISHHIGHHRGWDAVEDYNLVDGEGLAQTFGIEPSAAHRLEGLHRQRYLEWMQQARSVGNPPDQTKLLPPLGSHLEWLRPVSDRVGPEGVSKAALLARLFEIPFCCLHLPADNHLFWFVHQLLLREHPAKTGDLVELLRSVPEFAQAGKEDSASWPAVLKGSSEAPLGRVFLGLTGALIIHFQICTFELEETGFDTVVSLSGLEDTLSGTKLNYIGVPHDASDTLGINLLLDGANPHGELKILTLGRFRRLRR